MAEIYHSGAFLQQCWSVHPLCIQVRRMTSEHQLGLACTSCRFAHYLTLDSVVLRAPAGPDESDGAVDIRPAPGGGLERLLGCIETHAPALSLREMDVFEDVALVRCAECRRQYALHVASFETHQK
jgi:hypothetical protein